MTELSIIILCRNEYNSNNLVETLKSIHCQDFKNWECIVVDTTMEGRYKEQYDAMLSKISSVSYFHQSQITDGEAYNIGINKSEGEFLYFIRAGDTLINEEVLSKFNAYHGTNTFLWGDCEKTLLSGQVESTVYPSSISIHYILTQDILQQSVFIRKDVLQRYRFFREDIAFVTEWELLMHLICFARVRQRKLPFTIARVNEDKDLDTTLAYQKSDEREQILMDTFSAELYTKSVNYDFLEAFYNKRIFHYIRKTGGIFKKIGSPSYWKNIIYKKRNLFLLQKINPSVKMQMNDPLSIPVIIINYNKLSDLRKLVDFLIDRKHTKIVIVDNLSTYPPLLEYYKEITDKVTIEYMPINFGHLVFWKNNELNRKYSTGYHIVTDFDILPNENLPNDYLQQMIRLLNKHTEVTKVGFALRLDDIPTTLFNYDGIMRWESTFWKKSIGENMYQADIDTTFAIYPPMYQFNLSNFYKGIRIAGNFLARHGGFYIEKDSLSDEDRYYLETASNVSTWKRIQKEKEDNQ